jgi:hypothetical protein
MITAYLAEPTPRGISRISHTYDEALTLFQQLLCHDVPILAADLASISVPLATQVH